MPGPPRLPHAAEAGDEDQTRIEIATSINWAECAITPPHGFPNHSTVAFHVSVMEWLWKSSHLYLDSETGDARRDAPVPPCRSGTIRGSEIGKRRGVRPSTMRAARLVISNDTVAPFLTPPQPPRQLSGQTLMTTTSTTRAGVHLSTSKCVYEGGDTWMRVE